METTQNIEPKNYSAVIKWSIIIGIVIVINMFFNYAISLVYESPKYENFCKQEQVIAKVDTEMACVKKGGQWNANVYSEPETPGNCDLDFTCRQNYEEASKVYNRNVFVSLVIIGIILIAVSFAVAFNWTLSVALAMGGVLSIIIASIRYWSDADNLLRVIILFLALCALIYFAVRKFKN